MELVLGLIGTFTGIAGLVGSCIIAKKQAVFARNEAVKQERNNRLEFLSNVIFDVSIPRESRQPFYDEYIAMKGNGTVVKFWLLEGERAKLTAAS